MTGFSVKQMQALRRNLDPNRVRTRGAHGRQLLYIEGWYAISEANKIFGFDNWNRETLETKCVFARENRGTFAAVYTAKVRITVRTSGTSVVREGHGTGEGRCTAAGEAHDIALKTAETDATKRALATFGKRFGLLLYDKSQNSLKLKSKEGQTGELATSTMAVAEGGDLAEKLDRPSQKLSHDNRSEKCLPSHPKEVGKIDKSLLTIAVPKRVRNRAHLRYVATRPCLVCGRHPSDAHHLKFAQPKALGLKVSDEYTVPLCRGHHRELHRFGNEREWWQIQRINALGVAHELWMRTRQNLDHEKNASI